MNKKEQDAKAWTGDVIKREILITCPECNSNQKIVKSRKGNTSKLIRVKIECCNSEFEIEITEDANSNDKIKYKVPNGSIKIKDVSEE